MKSAKAPGINSYVRVLKLERRSQVDAEGRGIGDDFELADFGFDTDGTAYWLTTDGLHASDVADLGLDDPGALATMVAELVNRALGAKRRRRS